MLELLEEPAYRHVLANHLPVTGLAVAWVFLVVALVQRHRSTMLVALGLVALMAGSALPVATAGDDAYPFVYDALDGTGRAWLDHHLYLADRWVPILYANAVLALAAICIGVWRAQLLRRLAIGTALATAGGLAAACVIAEAGGKIAHPEFRLSEPPIHDSSGRLGRQGGAQ